MFVFEGPGEIGLCKSGIEYVFHILVPYLNFGGFTNLLGDSEQCNAFTLNILRVAAGGSVRVESFGVNADGFAYIVPMDGASGGNFPKPAAFDAGVFQVGGFEPDTSFSGGTHAAILVVDERGLQDLLAEGDTCFFPLITQPKFLHTVEIIAVGGVLNVKKADFVAVGGTSDGIFFGEVGRGEVVIKGTTNPYIEAMKRGGMVVECAAGCPGVVIGEVARIVGGHEKRAEISVVGALAESVVDGFDFGRGRAWLLCM